MRAARAGNIPAKPYRLPLPYTAEQIKSMPPRSVALGFASAIDTLGSAMTMFQLAKKGVMKPEQYTHEFHCPDGSTRKYIPRSIGEFEKFINHFRKMSLMYRKEIKKRGFERVKGKYNADLSSGCSLRWFAPGEVAVNQREFAFRISQGKKISWIRSGIHGATNLSGWPRAPTFWPDYGRRNETRGPSKKMYGDIEAK